MTDLFAWTNLFPARTGLPVKIWVNVDGRVATDTYHPENVSHPDEVRAWIEFNADVLAQHWVGDIDGVTMAVRTRKVP